MPVYSIKRKDSSMTHGHTKAEYLSADRFEMNATHIVFYTDNIPLAAIPSDNLVVIDIEAVDSKTELCRLAHGLRSRKKG